MHIYAYMCFKGKCEWLKAKIPPEQFPRSILVANVTRMSLTRDDEIWRVGRVTRMLRGNWSSGI